MKLKLIVKHEAADGSPGTWEDSIVILKYKGEREVAKRLHLAIKEALRGNKCEE